MCPFILKRLPFPAGPYSDIRGLKSGWVIGGLCTERPGRQGDKHRSRERSHNHSHLAPYQYEQIQWIKASTFDATQLMRKLGWIATLSVTACISTWLGLKTLPA